MLLFFFCQHDCFHYVRVCCFMILHLDNLSPLAINPIQICIKYTNTAMYEYMMGEVVDTSQSFPSNKFSWWYVNCSRKYIIIWANCYTHVYYNTTKLLHTHTRIYNVVIYNAPSKEKKMESQICDVNRGGFL